MRLLPKRGLSLGAVQPFGRFGLVVHGFVVGFDGFSKGVGCLVACTLCKTTAGPALLVAVFVSFVLADVLGKRFQVLSTNVPQRPLGWYVHQEVPPPIRWHAAHGLRRL